MAVAALVVWVVTATGGLVMAATWFAGGGPAQSRTGRSRFGPRLLLSHAGLAALGLVVWVVALVGDADGLRWLSVAVLPVVAALGGSMYVKWVGGRGAHAGVSEPDPPAEQRFPVVVVGAHGVFAAVTVVLALLAAAGVGD